MTTTTFESLGQNSIRLSVMPARAAYLVRPASGAGVRRAVQEASTRWGGITEPILPVPKNGRLAPWWKEVLRLSKVDGLVNVDCDASAAERLSDQTDLPLTDIADIDRKGITRYTSHPFHIDQLAYGKNTNKVVSARRGASLWEVIACGDLTDSAEEELSATVYGIYRPRTEDECGRAQLFENTLIGLTGSAINHPSAVGWTGPWPAVVWISTPNSVLDCTYFWNLRALRSYARMTELR